MAALFLDAVHKHRLSDLLTVCVRRSKHREGR